MISQLKVLLLLCTLYGIEFVVLPLFVSWFEVRYKKGLPSFLGVPTGASKYLLFPDFGFDFFVASRQLGFLWRQVQHLDTLAAVFFLKDRVCDYPAGCGYSFELLSCLTTLGLPELVNLDEKGLVLGGVGERYALSLEANEDRQIDILFKYGFFSCPAELYQGLFAASSLNLVAHCMLVLMWSGAVSVHILAVMSASVQCRFCPAPATTCHYFGCDLNVTQHLQKSKGKKKDVICWLSFSIIQKFCS